MAQSVLRDRAVSIHLSPFRAERKEEAKNETHVELCLAEIPKTPLPERKRLLQRRGTIEGGVGSQLIGREWRAKGARANATRTFGPSRSNYIRREIRRGARTGRGPKTLDVEEILLKGKRSAAFHGARPAHSSISAGSGGKEKSKGRGKTENFSRLMENYNGAGLDRGPLRILKASRRVGNLRNGPAS